MAEAVAIVIVLAILPWCAYYEKKSRGRMAKWDAMLIEEKRRDTNGG